MTFDRRSPLAPAIQAPLRKRSKLRFNFQLTRILAAFLAVQSAISFDENTGVGSNTVWNTTYSLDGLGQLVSATIADGKTRTVSYTNDESGQILRRTETLPSNVPSGQTELR